ncbi:SMEK domain-containing protein [Citrobacter braakii]|uniref:SMEK domain-containing protein n=2 Tax=Citrobacter TaxID=544 RepID=UPI0015EAA493|nr:SMEK domain-containing protein [Citrobacter braakii]MBM3063346.1 SMEK domain-containing protein [Citrobacter braakii]MBM3068887.1 SMEK domain-containing protein [Citrobacter braakii]QLS56209.1 SMEK domain-containing protein [Citrobacter sp. RHBSTW-00887]
MIRQELLQRTISLLGRFAHEVKVSNAMGLFDINTLAEDFLIPVFSVAYDCPDLCNQNRIQMNFPAVDLGCKTSRTSIQITSDPSSSKVCETLKKFDSHNLHNDFDRLYVYVISEKQNSYTSKSLALLVSKLSIDFDTSYNILDFRDLAKKFEELTIEKIKNINDYLEEGFRTADSKLKFHANLVEFMEVSQKKIEDEKLTKKYIPSIFVETSETKEEMRYFANPMFFYRKIDDDLRNINLTKLNELLIMAKIMPITDDLYKISNLKKPTDLYDIRTRFLEQYDLINEIHKFVSPFSWYGEQAERYESSEDSSDYWEVFRLGIQSGGSGIYRALENILKKIIIAQAKIFLITGMAGQGKTNFICDLVEHQFRAFEIPTIFIPARSLNDYAGPNRILSYITNNRFAPSISHIHDLFNLLNSVAEECKKPFIIAIDGINEIGDLNGFVAELRVFLEALVQYDFVKILITCRNEFFDHKFSDVFEPQFSTYLYRVKNLRKEMSENNKSRLLKSYIEHFKIKSKLSGHAKDFLKNDLILLRIFCEINQGKNIGYVSDIYKGDMFEQYLIMKLKEFPNVSQQKALRSIYKICSQMLNSKNFSQVSIERFDESEKQIVEKLIGEDIILRREVPSIGLSSIGIENISFTYDELRDFLLAYYVVSELAVSHAEKVNEIMGEVSGWPIYEGFFRYVYLLARKQKNECIQSACEKFDDFKTHYLNNLHLLSADIQTHQDVARLEAVLMGESTDRELRQVFWFLFKKRDESECLNVSILLHCLNKLNESESGVFIKSIFSGSFGYSSESWRSSVSSFLSGFLNLSEEKKLQLGAPSLSLVLFFLPYALWSESEAVTNFFVRFKNEKEIIAAMNTCTNAVSVKVQNCLKEIFKGELGYEG